MKITTSRFGVVQFEKENEFLFPEGVLGFENLRPFVFVDDPEDELFIWMQSCEKSHIAFPLLETSLFNSNYEIHLSKNDLEALSLKDSESYESLSVITIPEDPRQMSANLKAPIIINTKKNLGRQCVLPEEHLPICDLIFSRLSQRFMASSSFSFKRKSTSLVGSILSRSAVEKAPGDYSSLNSTSSEEVTNSKSSQTSEVELEA